jgi:predicted signal transduction protein with EAL and GGDEF domain
VLQHFADTMAARLDTGSIIGRLGGEEFAAILPGADLATAALAAEAIRSTFERSAAMIDEVPVSSTVSVGVASSDDIDCDLATLFHKADGALYMAKNAGRNRVELIGPHELIAPDAQIDEAVYVRTQGKRDETLRGRWSTMRRYRGAAAPLPRRGPRVLS